MTYDQVWRAIDLVHNFVELIIQKIPPECIFLSVNKRGILLDSALGETAEPTAGEASARRM